MKAKTTLDDMTQFRTRKGLHMPYPQEPLDRWIGRDVSQTDVGEYLDHGTGELLDPRQSKEYEEYRQRFFKRCKLGGKADKLVRIVDKSLRRTSPPRAAPTQHVSPKKLRNS